MARGLQPKVSLLGRVSLETNGAAVDEARLPGRQGRLLFAYLVAERGRAVPRDELAEALWGEAPPPSWDKALTGIVSKLRGLLAEQGIDGASALTGAFGCYRLDLPEGTWVDVLAAATAADEAAASLAAGDLDTARSDAALAESLLREPFLPGEDGPWVEDKRRMSEGAWVGLDVHARKVVAGVLSGGSGEVRSLRVPVSAVETVEWLQRASWAGPSRVRGWADRVRTRACIDPRERLHSSSRTPRHAVPTRAHQP
jgi:hypothetical protein